MARPEAGRYVSASRQPMKVGIQNVGVLPSYYARLLQTDYWILIVIPEQNIFVTLQESSQQNQVFFVTKTASLTEKFTLIRIEAEGPHPRVIILNVIRPDVQNLREMPRISTLVNECFRR
jgi:hypothetical protein